MELKVVIGKKYFVFIILIIIIATAIVGVIASHTSSTPNPGHDINEIGNIPTCSDGQVLTHDGTGIKCVDDEVGIAGTATYNNCVTKCQTSANTQDATWQTCNQPRGFIQSVMWAKNPSGVDDEHICIVCCERIIQ